MLGTNFVSRKARHLLSGAARPSTSIPRALSNSFAKRATHFPDQESLSRLGMVVAFFARNWTAQTDFAAITLKHFITYGGRLFRQTLENPVSGTTSGGAASA